MVVLKLWFDTELLARVVELALFFGLVSSLSNVVVLILFFSLVKF